VDQEELGTRPNSGRMLDYWLGGFNNLEIDRVAADQVVQAVPDAANILIAQRHFLQRAVAHLCEQGVKRFLDIGAGLPTAGNTHEVAHMHHPDAQVIYADYDPITVTSATTLLKDVAGVSFLRADARKPQEFFQHPDVQALLAQQEPVCFIAVGLLHFLNGDEVRNLVSTAYAALPSGSFWVASQGTEDAREHFAPGEVERVRAVYTRGGTPFCTRSLEETVAIIAPWKLTEDGIHLLEQWRPDPDDLSIFGEEPWRARVYGFVATK
jgi:O-methyltransferase involved in polyketide biosynthesis